MQRVPLLLEDRMYHGTLSGGIRYQIHLLCFMQEVVFHQRIPLEVRIPGRILNASTSQCQSCLNSRRLSGTLFPPARRGITWCSSLDSHLPVLGLKSCGAFPLVDSLLQELKVDYWALPASPGLEDLVKGD